ncbi:alpha/beta hydrolase [Calycomorphotria hydatis]|uniref:Esterase n=1 Tax=Calycomorphotria hydatis TaxID=2528027 RepID=A0A517T550_9PLAN|nr:hypothetical protein [Calycomorphotria hydatis]QDT63498.1 hypothetical protein V22_07200 [Calycomorphotria hydatis]
MTHHRFLWTDQGTRNLHQAVDLKSAAAHDLHARYSAEDVTELYPSSRTASVATELNPHSRPTELWVPDHYEALYPYPLILWLHDDADSEQMLHEVMPRLSERNYLGLSMRADIIAGNGFRWSRKEEDRQAFASELYETACNARREYHIHSERVFLAGIGGGADLAVELFMNNPSWFGGLFALDGRFDGVPADLEHDQEFEGKPALFARTGVTGLASIASLATASRRLSLTGTDVSVQTFDAPRDGEIPQQVLTALNRWIMSSIGSVV